MVVSDITGTLYDESDCVFFRNYIQAAYYMEWGCKLIDLFTDSEHKLVFVFLKADHKKYIDKWIKQKTVVDGEK